MNYFKLSVGIFIALAAARFIPHPPNFTSLLALSFYIPLFFGRKYIFSILLSFFITDLFIGFHSITFFTWGSVVLIGLSSKFFINTLATRIMGSLSGACLFYIITNFGVWSQGSYGYSLNGIINCYTLALPFFTYSLISTLIYSGVIEVLFHKKAIKKYISLNNSI